ncbi:hypothetical protein PFICI_10324 [Pestalotiopsis fici W106-1]|uniref:Protein kinase domain-containing protein n=1 Tax=Pestalotiopsis fici (strain W106-1 / CGMCC3.15140) TaxID=1229662 RepID=W3WYT5_PESFW|nr:uncharacterized protein PFICI_10324 [Pestalotiopsis fici W106-1]ETS78262.1 hypothetical protein PFICI_10324 [Pestalotiopsis fici W106-1]
MSLSSRISRSAKKLVPERVLNWVAAHQLRQAQQNWDNAMAQAARAAQAAQTEAASVAYMTRRCQIVQTFFESRYNLKFERSVGDGNHGATGVFRATKARPGLRRVSLTLGPRPAGVGSRAASASGGSGGSGGGGGGGSIRTASGGSSHSGSSRGSEHFDKYLIKFSLGSAGKDGSDRHLRNEARWLRIFNGSEHFVRTCNISYLMAQGAAEQEEADPNEDARAEAATPAEDHNPGHDRVLTAEEHESFRGMIPVADHSNGTDTRRWIPCLVLEYLPLGDLDSLRQRFIDASIRHGTRPPVRLLWGLALCMVRMCIGMAYVQNVRPGTRETIPPTGRPGTLAHNSIKGPNMLLDVLHPTDGEHEITPLLKLIDFGRTAYKPPDASLPYSDGPGAYRNLFYIGSVLATLACPEIPLQRGCSWIRHDQLWEWWGPGQGRSRLLMATHANKIFCSDRQIAYDFRLFVGQLMSAVAEGYHTRVRPTLQQALARCENGCNQGPHDEAPETPEQIREYVNYVVLGAMPPQQPPPPEQSQPQVGQ